MGNQTLTGFGVQIRSKEQPKEAIGFKATLARFERYQKRHLRGFSNLNFIRFIEVQNL